MPPLVLFIISMTLNTIVKQIKLDKSSRAMYFFSYGIRKTDCAVTQGDNLFIAEHKQIAMAFPVHSSLLSVGPTSTQVWVFLWTVKEEERSSLWSIVYNFKYKLKKLPCLKTICNKSVHKLYLHWLFLVCCNKFATNCQRLVTSLFADVL